MQHHSRPLSVRRASAERDACLRQERDAAIRAEADALLGERGYTMTRCDFSAARGTYTIAFYATDDRESHYWARDEDARLLMIRTYPVRVPFAPRHPGDSRLFNQLCITRAFIAAARAGFDALNDFAAHRTV